MDDHIHVWSWTQGKTNASTVLNFCRAIEFVVPSTLTAMVLSLHLGDVKKYVVTL